MGFRVRIRNILFSAAKPSDKRTKKVQKKGHRDRTIIKDIRTTIFDGARLTDFNTSLLRGDGAERHNTDVASS